MGCQADEKFGKRQMTLVEVTSERQFSDLCKLKIVRKSAATSNPAKALKNFAASLQQSASHANRFFLDTLYRTGFVFHDFSCFLLANVTVPTDIAVAGIELNVV